METELLINNRRLSPREQESLRKKVVRTATRYLKPNGKINAALVSDICECSISHVRHTWKKYRDGGIHAIKTVPMGRPRNSGGLSVERQQEIKKLIVDKCPNQLKLKGFLWDREQVRDLIRRRFGVSLTVQSVGTYLRSWGFSAQRPIKRNHKQNSEAVNRWLANDYPAIKARAHKENCEIAWGDETGCQNETNYVKGYAPVGQTPVLPVGNSRIRINMISAITNRGKLRFMFYRESMNAKIMIQFMQRLIKDNSRKLFLILDNLKVHHAKLVRSWLKEHEHEIEILYLPPYSPEYNPDEYLNGNLKREIAKKGYSESVEELESKARGTMKSFQCDKARVTSFFKGEHVRYAA